MSKILKKLKKDSKKRRKMMALILGFSDVKELCRALNYREKKPKERMHSMKKAVNALNDNSISPVYSNKFSYLRDTLSFNPHNDYNQHFIDTGQRPQNFIRETCLSNRFKDCPKLKELVKLKNELIQETATPPMFLKCDLNTYDFEQLNIQFDVILVEPPLEEYQLNLGVSPTELWNWNQIMHLNLSKIAAKRSFIFLWCGSSDGLDKGRDCLRHWGFRRCEDICWVQTNFKHPKWCLKTLESNSVFQHTKEHCLMGIKGTVRRSTDGDFIHTNIDTDIIISEANEYGCTEKPVEIFNIIEHFCLGKKRLHLFGRDNTIRPGWLTLGNELTSSNFNIDVYNGYFSDGQLTTGCTNRIEKLRPKSPVGKNNVS